MKNIVIYFPNGTETYFEIGGVVVPKDNNGKEIGEPFTVSKIIEKDNKITVFFSNQTNIVYCGLPWTNKN